MRAAAGLVPLLLLVGCAATPRQAVPSDLGTPCQAVPVPLPPRKPRTPDSIAGWGNAGELALREANRRLAECDSRRGQAVQLLERAR